MGSVCNYNDSECHCGAGGNSNKSGTDFNLLDCKNDKIVKVVKMIIVMAVVVVVIVI